MVEAALQLLLLLVVLVSSNGQFLYETQPRLRTQNGNFVLVSAKNKNITLQTFGPQSYININGENLVSLVAQAKSSVQTVNDLQSNYLANLQTSLSDLTSSVLGVGGLSQRTFALEGGLTNITRNLTRLRRSATGRIGALNIRLQRLEKNFKTMRRNLKKNECESNPCLNGGTCEDAFRNFYCRCPPGWEGATCNEDVNECARFVGTDLGCQNGATCTNKPGSYECQCRTGFFGLHCTQTTNECVTSSAAELCGHGTCIPQKLAGRTYTCLCDQGWTAHRETGACTVDVNECEAQTRPACSVNPPVPCINTPGSFQCGQCPQGFTGNGFYCSDIDECLTENGGCSDNPRVACINTMGSRVCGPCPPGFSGDGVTCVASRPCASNNGGCHPLARCYDNPTISSSFVQCACPKLFDGSGFGPNGCVRSNRDNDSDVCYPNPCANGRCYPSAKDLFNCECYPGYTGALCQNPIMDNCNPNPCQNNGVCSVRNGSTRCTCQSGFNGPQCQYRIADCGGVVNQDSGRVSYSSVIQRGTSEVNCIWRIIASEALVVKGTFTNFNISKSPSCDFDWIQIHDGPRPNSPSMGTFCGGKAPPVSVISTSNALVLWYHAPEPTVFSNFEFTWNASRPECGGIMEGQQGTIKSPGFPGKYPTNRNCTWFVSVRKGKRVKVNVFTMQLEKSVNCDRDYVEIWDSHLDTGKRLRTICNSSDTLPITSTGSHMMIRFHSNDVSSDEEIGFEMIYTEVPGVQGCGGVYTAEVGDISSPNYPQNYAGNLHCEYLIQLPVNERIKIRFMDFRVERGENCKYDYLEIREGSDEDAPLVNKLCGFELPSPFISNGNELILIFHTDASTTSKGFKLKYETACGGTFTASSGLISTPNYPNLYPPNRQCIYTIAAPLHHAVVLEFLDLKLESHGSCAHDSVTIRDGASDSSPYLGKFCGTKLPPITLSSSNYLWIKFSSDASLNYVGFAANFSVVGSDCGGILANESGAIASTSAIGVCTYVIHVPRGNVIRLSWTKMRSDSVINGGRVDCWDDFVAVYDNSTAAQPNQLIGKYCGSKTPPMLTSLGNVMTVVMNQTTGDAEFALAYVSIKSSTLCGGSYYSNYGMIKSPKYPKKYDEDLDCIYTISVPEGQQIEVNFTYFDLENSSECGFDYIEIRNGKLPSSPLVGKFCGSTVPPVFSSHSNNLWMLFHTDNSIQARGFRMIWDGASTGCGGEMKSLTGHIESPNYPQPYGTNAECVWTIYVAKGSKIALSVIDLDIEAKTSGSDICFDYIEIRDGSNLLDPVLEKFCDSTGGDRQIVSSGNAMRIMFKTDISDAGRGFSMRYRTVCNNTLSGHRGVIESPNFPDDYPHNSNCTWTILAPPGNQINVSFSHFRIEKIDAACSVDYIKLKTGRDNNTDTELIGTYCSTEENPGIITTKYNTLYVNFVTDFSISYGGFRMEWVVHGCGGRFEAPYGTLSTPNYPRNYPPSTECRWEIIVDVDKSVELTIVDLSLEVSQDCSFDSLKVYGGPDEKSPLLLQSCAVHDRIQKVTSSGRYMTVYFRSDHSLTGKGLYAYYRSTFNSCGGRLSANEGGIHSKNFPQNFETNSTCNWLIEVDPNYTVQLDFAEFDVPKINNSCDQQYVAVYDGPHRFSPLLLKHCGSELPPKINSTTHFLTVLMVTGERALSKGFSATYQMHCGATIKAGTYSTGTLRSVNIRRHLFNEDSLTGNCTWIIMAENSTSKVNLAITHLDLDDSTMFSNETGCALQYVEVRDGVGLDAPLRGKYCNKRIPPHIVSNGYALTVNLVSIGGFVHSKFFTATYSVDDSACGGLLTSEEGSFASPGYPGSYKLESECIWQIGASPGNRLELTFSMFEIEQSESCNNDYLEIRNGSSATDPLIGVYCGDRIPSNITATRSLWIKFRSDGQNVAAGFLAHYSLKHGGELFGQTGSIANPLYPRPLSSYGTYWWRIRVRQMNAIKLDFKEFYLNSIGCLTSIKIFDGSDESAPMLKEFCEEHSNPEPVVTSGNIAYIELSSNPMWVGAQFLINWSAVRKPRSPNTAVNGSECGGRFTFNGTVEIASPGFPHGYKSDLNCEWIFEAPPNFHAALYFNTLDVEQHTLCSYDSVAVYSGSRYSSEWTYINKFCHPNVTQLLGVHASDMIKVVFKTDHNGNKTGFSASILSVCGSSLEGPNGLLNISSLQMPSNFGMHPICEWNVTVRPGRTIQVDISSIHITGSPPCSDNYLMLKNGHTSESPLLGDGRYCGTTPPGASLETSGNKLYIRYNNNLRQRAGSANDLEGFTMTWKETKSTCGGWYNFADGTGPKLLTIMSPNHPRPPPTNTECEWVFLAPSGKRLRVDFKERMAFQYSKNCESAYVEFFNGGSAIAQSLGRFCRDAPSSLITSDNALFVRYVTTAKEPRSGFSADVVVDVCGGTIRSETNMIDVPEFSSNGPVTCVWNIISTGNLLSYSFESLNMASDAGDCSSNYVEIKEVFQASSNAPRANSTVAQSQFRKRYCGSAFNRTYVTTGSDQLVITLNSTRSLGRSAQKYFKMFFRSIHNDCGGFLKAPEGEITSPGYPDSQSKRQMCTWVITVPEGRRIKVEFVDFDLDGTRSTCQQWLGIYNDHSSILPIGLYCGGENPPEISSSSNKMMIQSLTWHTSTHRGFKIKFSSDLPTVCEGNIQQNFGSLSFPVLNMSSIFCQWKRVVAGGTLSMTIQNASINANPDSSCFRSSRNLLIGHDSSYSLAQFCGSFTEPKIVTNPYPETLITARQNSLENKISFNMDYRFYNCGGLLRGPMDSIQSPDNMSMDCAWSLTYAYGQINLTIVTANFTADCSEQYIKVFNGMASSWPLIGKFCKGNPPPPNIFGQSGQMYIEYHGSAKVPPGSGFLINTTLVQRGCGGIFHAASGMIASPNYPRQYGNNSECTWELVVDEGYYIGLKFIHRFFIETSPNCTKDFLEVFDYAKNDWQSMGKVCGRDIPKQFNSTSNKMRVLFRSDNQTRADGFVALWNVHCGGVITDPEGYLISPSYPSNYGKFLNCKYVIRAPNKAIMYQFQDFSLEQGFQDCRYDNLTVVKRSVSKNRYTSYSLSKQTYCGQEAPPDGVSMGFMSITFQTDKWIEKRGFRMKFKIFMCGGVINETTLRDEPLLNPELTSVQYLLSINCTWTIEAPTNKNILIRFSDVNIKRSGRCEMGAIKLFNSSWPDANKITTTLCGNISNTASTVVSKSSVMTLSYTAFKAFMRPKPFVAAISFTYGAFYGCGGELNASSAARMIGSYSANGRSGNYENMLDCQWVVQVNSGESVKLTVNNFDVKDCNGTGSPTSSCDCDYLEVRDGYNQFSPLIGKFCGTTRPPSLTSSGTRMFIRFVSDDYQSASGFQARIQKIASPCGPRVLQVDDTLRELTSPGWGSRLNYAPNLRCRWQLRTTEAMRFDLHLVEYDLEESVNCQSDQLMITEDAEPGEEGAILHTGERAANKVQLNVYSPRADSHHESLFCGKGGQIDWYSRRNFADILFVSDGNNMAGKGFRLQYQYARCSRNFTRQYGRIHYQGQQKQNVFNGDCSILISTEPNRTIALYFSELYTHRRFDGKGCNSSSVYKIYDGAMTSAAMLAEYCGVSIPNPVFSTGPFLLIKAKQSTFWSEEGFDVTYTTSDKGRGCGGVVRSVAGSVTSPLYPGKAGNYTECVWEITVPVGSYVHIIFTAFNIGTPETCSTDYLKFYEVEAVTGKETFRSQLCGNIVPSSFSANTNSVLLKYTTSIHNSGTGWKLNYGAMKNSP